MIEKVEKPRIYFLYITTQEGVRKMVTMRTTPTLFDKTTETKIKDPKTLDIKIMDGCTLETIAIKPFGYTSLFWKAGSR
jgi:hypothetical protein